MLDLDPNRIAVPARDAATLVVLRDGSTSVEVFCVERNRGAAFLGGAVVFPGGKVDDADRSPAWSALVAPHRHPHGHRLDDDTATPLRALAIAACRESLEEAAILPLVGHVLPSHSELLALRADIAGGQTTLAGFLTERSLLLDLGALRLFARWVTPASEARRFDARFFAVRAPQGQIGAHDESETMASFWASPRAILERFDMREIQLVPPTHRTLELIASARSCEEAFACFDAVSIEPICPERVPHGETIALALPGDPAHTVKEARVPGPSRYVLRGEHWRPEPPPLVQTRGR